MTVVYRFVGSYKHSKHLTGTFVLTFAFVSSSSMRMKQMKHLNGSRWEKEFDASSGLVQHETMIFMTLSDLQIYS